MKRYFYRSVTRTSLRRTRRGPTGEKKTITVARVRPRSRSRTTRGRTVRKKITFDVRRKKKTTKIPFRSAHVAIYPRPIPLLRSRTTVAPPPPPYTAQAVTGQAGSRPNRFRRHRRSRRAATVRRPEPDVPMIFNQKSLRLFRYCFAQHGVVSSLYLRARIDVLTRRGLWIFNDAAP